MFLLYYRCMLVGIHFIINIKNMKKILLFSLIFSMAFLLIVNSSEAKKSEGEKCTTIQSGELLASDGSVIDVGFDSWGYNYQGMMFRGGYCDAYRDASWCQAYKDDYLLMKWNEAWVSNKDCDGDGKLDRHYGYSSYIGSGAWLTNHQAGEYMEGEDVCKWNYFIKIVAAPEDAILEGGSWYTADGVEIGASIWGQFVIIQEVYNDSCYNEHGLQVLSDFRAGLGNW